MNKLEQLAQVGQSVWLDYIRRSFVDSGELQSWIDRGVRGVTSNPSIFQKAIAGSTDYDDQLRALVDQKRSTRQVYEALVLADIARVADLLRPVYDDTAGTDGYVSLEVDPTLADDTAGTVAEARYYHEKLGRPNVMIKVPATPAGFPAVEQLIAAGINVNVTLIFSLDQYRATAQAYLSGLEQLAAAGGDPARVASVASFFVSRVDTAVDRELARTGETALQGTIAVANAKAAFALSHSIYAGERWERLQAQGARPQRLLWASTSTKNPQYSDVKYVEELIGPNTVNTVPPTTLDLYLDHGAVASALEQGLDRAQEALDRLASLGIDLGDVTQRLLEDGVASFAAAFQGLMDSISEKRDRLLEEWDQISVDLGPYRAAVDAALDEMRQDDVIRRIWAHDYRLWKPDPAEITNRLGWLDIAERMVEQVDCLQALADDVWAEGYRQTLLLGMGGSSLAPEVFAKTLAGETDYLDLHVLDMTDPDAVLAQAKRLELPQTLFIVSTKSGRTVETLSFFKRFYTWLVEDVGPEEAGRHFVAITDPGSRLATIAREYDFRTIFFNDPNIGGRYSALSYFGLAPAALIGVDLDTLLDRALTMACNCEACNCMEGGNNAGALLGATISELAAHGRDKLTFVLSPEITAFGDWVEQLIAESTGKEGRGIVPVVGEPLGPPDVYGTDRTFVYLRLDGDDTYDAAVHALQDAGQPVLRIRLRDRYDLGQQFFLWEMATAVAGHRMGINPFDQPNVEAAKRRASEMVERFREEGTLPEGERTPLERETLLAFLDHAQEGDYVALQAYIEPTPERDLALQRLRSLIRDRYRLATTVGYGPRFLHSTGQLHKGGAGNGLFIQLTDDSVHDVPIPDEAGAATPSISFGILEEAQALGDQQALLDAGRRVIRLHLGSHVIENIEHMIDMLS
ncbi:MAG: bifunctional transaldolase/phosoglucose isomerase [Anaerolineae bacterium]|nr:bifunctional transaldolase/phosoglucose isomerase [Anaerolineae bacterium]